MEQVVRVIHGTTLYFSSLGENAWIWSFGRNPTNHRSYLDLPRYPNLEEAIENATAWIKLNEDRLSAGKEIVQC